MKRVAVTVILALSIVSAVSCNNARTRQSIASITTASPSPQATVGYVTDTAKVIDESSRQQLESTLAALKERKKIDFSVVTMGTTGDKSVRDYSLTLARERKSSSNDKNVIAGLLLLVAVDDRKWHIQITRNLEDDLTNEILTKLSEPMTESFQQKRYAEGVIKYVNAVIEQLEQVEF